MYVRSHESRVTCHLSPVTCHLTITICSFSCYDSPRMLGDAAEGGLVIDRVKKSFFLCQKLFFLTSSYLGNLFY